MDEEGKIIGGNEKKEEDEIGEKSFPISKGKRITAWVLLAGFIFLLSNVFFIGYKRDISIIIYLIILFCYIIVMHRIT